MGRGSQPENWGSYVCNQWMKLIHDQKLAKFLVCRAVLAKIYDIVDIKLHYDFWPEMGVMPHMWAKHTPMGQNAHLWVSCPVMTMKMLSYYWWINRILFKLKLDLYYIIIWLNQLNYSYDWALFYAHIWLVVGNLLHVLYPVIENAFIFK